jgi:hypothetical protein
MGRLVGGETRKAGDVRCRRAVDTQRGVTYDEMHSFRVRVFRLFRIHMMCFFPFPIPLKC